MQQYNFIKFDNELVYIYPSIGHMIGITKEVSKVTQTDLLEVFDETI